MKETLPTKAALDQEVPEGGVRYRTLFIVPKRDFGPGPGHFINGRYVKEGFVVTDGICNVMPGAAWFQTVDEAKHAIDVLIGVKGDAEMFWDIILPFRCTPGEEADVPQGHVQKGRFWAKVENHTYVEVGILEKAVP